MKKTQSLKLMLLGLLALGSTSAWAQYADVDGVVYGLSADCKSANVVGVLGAKLSAGTNGGDKAIQIADQVTIKTYGNGKTYTVPVKDFAEGWMKAGTYECEPIPGTAGTNVNPSSPVQTGDGISFPVAAGDNATAPVGKLTYTTSDASKIGKLEIILKASQLTEIARTDFTSDEKGTLLPIAAFIVDETSGITAIPQALLAKCKTKKVSATDPTVVADLQRQIGDKQSEIATLEQRIAANVEDTYVSAIKDGKVTAAVANGKYTGKQVYLLLRTNEGIELSADKKPYYVILGEESDETDAWGYKLNKLIKIYPDGNVAEQLETKGWLTKDASLILEGGAEEIQRVITVEGNNQRFVVATIFTGSTDATILQKGLQTLADEADANYENLKSLYNAAKIAEEYTHVLDDQIKATNKFNKIAVMKAKFDQVRDAWKDAGYRITNAVAAGSDAGLRTDEKEVYNEIMEAMRTAEFPKLMQPKEGAEQITTTGGKKVFIPTDAFVTKYGNLMITSSSYLFIGNGTEETKDPVTYVNEDGYSLNDHTLTIGTNAAHWVYDESESENIYLTEAYIDEKTTGLLYYDDEVIGTPAYAAGDYELRGYAKPSFELMNDAYYTALTEKEAADKAVEDYVAYTDPVLKDEKGDPVTYNMEEFGELVDGETGSALAAKEAAHDALEDAKDADKNGAGQLATLNGELTGLQTQLTAEQNKKKDAPDLTSIEKNEDLLLAEFNNKKIESFGASALQDCVKAEVNFAEDKFPATLKKIESKAFQNTLLDQLDLTATGQSDWRGDKKDGKDVADGKVDRKDRLNKNDIAADAFTGTPLTKALLSTTDLNGRTVRDILQSLKKNEEKFVADFCDYEFEFAKEMVNITVTTVTLPDLGEEFDYGTDSGVISEETCAGLWNLTSITIPTYLRGIEANAFAFTNVPEFDLTQMIGLIEVGDGAFSFNPSLTSVKFAKKAPLRSLTGSTYFKKGLPFNISPELFELMGYDLVGDDDDDPTYMGNMGVFTNSCALTEVVFNDAIECLGTGLFATNKLAELNLKDTQVQALNNLFLTGTKEDAVYADDEEWITGYRPSEGVNWHGYGEPRYHQDENNVIGYWDGVPDTCLTKIELPESLLFVNSFALSGLQNKNLKSIVVPSTVRGMGAGVFRNSSYLETISFINTPMQNFEKGTFEQCLNLKQVIFRTINGVQPSFVNASVYFRDISEGTSELCIDGSYLTSSIQGNMQYCFDDVLFNGRPNKDKVEVIVTKDDLATLKDWHNSFSTLTGYQPTLKLKKVGDYYWSTFVSPYAAAQFDEKDCVVFSAYQDGNDVVLYPAKIKGGKYKVAAYDPNNGQYAYRYYQNNYTQYSWWAGYQEPDEVSNYIAACRASIAVVRSTKAEVNYDEKFGTTVDMDNNGLHIAPKWESTLDDENALRYLEEEVKPTTNFNWYKFGAHDGKAGFYHITSGKLAEGSIGLMGEAVEGLSRLNLTIVEPNEATAIQGVKEYLDGVKSGAIYNLNGVRVSTPVKGQMYIQNGKKFIQK